MATSKQAKQAKGKGSASADEDKQRKTSGKGGSASDKGDAKAKQEDAELDAESDNEVDADAEIDETEDNEIENEIDAVDESEELDELISILEDGELTDIDPEEGTELLDEWQEILSNSGDADLKEIGKSLKQLKKALSSSKSQPEDIAAVLNQLGEQTNSYADNAERGYKTKLHKLGKALSKAGKSLEQEAE